MSQAVSSIPEKRQRFAIPSQPPASTANAGNAVSSTATVASFVRAAVKGLREACLNVKCSQPIGVWERFCPECGQDQPQEREQRQQRVHVSGDQIRQYLQQQRYDLAVAELHQLDSLCTTVRLRPAAGPGRGTRQRGSAAAARCRADSTACPRTGNSL
jgi:hypothetical protein